MMMAAKIIVCLIVGTAICFVPLLIIGWIEVRDDRGKR